MQQTNNQCNAAENFQPRQIERQCDRDGPRENLVIINVVGELNWIEGFDRAGINENAPNDKTNDPPEEIDGRNAHLLHKQQTSNAERPTPHTQLAAHSELSVGRRALDVRRLLHLFFFSQASHPPSSTNTSGSCASRSE